MTAGELYHQCFANVKSSQHSKPHIARHFHWKGTIFIYLFTNGQTL